jgi:hypothetical protein
MNQKTTDYTINYILIFFVYSCFFFSKAFAYQYEVSVCSIFQNEDRFLKEWIDYHRLIGIDHFYMYDNESTDNALDILAPYITAGIVEYIPWEKNYDSPKEWWHVQREAYIDALKRSEGNSKWLCIIDTDEFIVPVKDYNLKTFLKDFDDYGGVCINWIFYGTSGIKRIPQDKWMVSCLLYRAKLSFSGHRTVKSIVRPERVDPQKSSFPHVCVYRDNFYHVNPNKKQLKRSELFDICIDRIRLHHYWSRDMDFLLQNKFLRNERWYGTEKALKKIHEETKMNDCYDPVILDVIKKIRSEKSH